MKLLLCFIEVCLTIMFFIISFCLKQKNKRKFLIKINIYVFQRVFLKNKKLEGMFSFQYVGINLIKHIMTSFIEVYCCISLKIIHKLIEI